MPQQEKKPKTLPLWQRILWLIPKNLVYLFGCVIVGAFIGMCIITTTDINMDSFLAADRAQEYYVVSPVYKHLKSSMKLDKQKVPVEQSNQFDLKKLNTQYLIKNRPVKVEKLADKWPAVKKWDLDYLKAKVGFATSMTSVIYRNSDQTPWNRAQKHPTTYPHSIEETITMIRHNGQKRQITNDPETGEPVEDESPNGFYFLDDDMLRSQDLRDDYEFPPLHKFLRLQRTSLSLYPKELGSLQPRQQPGEGFLCLANGDIEVKLLSGVFSQNLYQGAFGDLNSDEIPEFIDLFNEDVKNTFPLFFEVGEYILTTRMTKGDCLYIPQFWWISYQSYADVSIFLQFSYESSSKLSELLFTAIQEGLTEGN